MRDIVPVLLPERPAVPAGMPGEARLCPWPWELRMMNLSAARFETARFQRRPKSLGFTCDFQEGFFKVCCFLVGVFFYSMHYKKTHTRRKEEVNGKQTIGMAINSSGERIACLLQVSRPAAGYVRSPFACDEIFNSKHKYKISAAGVDLDLRQEIKAGTKGREYGVLEGCDSSTAQLTAAQTSLCKSALRAEKWTSADVAKPLERLQRAFYPASPEEGN